MLTQNFDVRVFQGKNGTIEIRVWRNGDCSCSFINSIGERKIIGLLVGATPIVERRISSLLRLANDEAIDEDIQVIKDAMSDLYRSDWIAKE